MENTFKLSIFFMALFLSACNTFDQAAFNEGFSLDDQKDYTVPTSLPSTEVEFSMQIHGGDKLEWLVKEVTLFGFPGSQSCRMDDQMILNADGTYQFDGGSVSCGGEDVTIRSGVYVLDYDNGELIFDQGSSDEVVVKVSGLDQGVIALSTSVDIFGASVKIEGVYAVE